MIKYLHVLGENHFKEQDVSNIRNVVLSLASTDTLKTLILLENYDDDKDFYKHKLKDRVEILRLEPQTLCYDDLISKMSLAESFSMREMGVFQRIITLAETKDIDRIIVAIGDTHLRKTKYVKKLGHNVLYSMLTEWCHNNKIGKVITRSMFKEIE